MRMLARINCNYMYDWRPTEETLTRGWRLYNSLRRRLTSDNRLYVGICYGEKY